MKRVLFLFITILISFYQQVVAQERFITVASTTSTENSGLYDYLLPAFTEETQIEVRVVAVGTGQAIRIASSGDADVLLVHHRPSEENFVEQGYGVKRFDVMYNDFVIIGPNSDPAGVRGMNDVSEALNKIYKQQRIFVSRGDDSGTHKKELSLWNDVGIDPTTFNSNWYRESGSGMGATLNVANGMGGYVMSDRSTWLNFENKGDLELLVQGDPRMFNYYGVILVNPERFPHIKAELGQQFIDWILSKQGQSVIGEYKIHGRQAFFPNAS